MIMAETMTQEDALHATSSLSKAQKAALIFLFLEEKGAASLFDHMSDDEIKIIGSTLLKMDEIPVEEMSLVLGEFYESLGSPIPNEFSGKRLFEKLVEKSLPEERRGRIFSVDDIKGGRGSIHNPLESMFVVLTPEQVYNLIKTEHSQTIAVILTLIKPNLSKDVLNMFGGEQQTDILYRMSLLSSVSEDVILILEANFKPKISSFGEVRDKQSESSGIDVPGVDIVLKFLRTQDWAKTEEIIDSIEKANPEVAKVLRKRIFTLEDLLRTDNSGIRALLKNIETGDLSLALKSAVPSVQNLFFQNMSTRAAAILKEDMEVATQKPEDVEAATEKILNEAKRLIKDGEIVLQSIKE
jgi:flagellar motor switch protein FliG